VGIGVVSEQAASVGITAVPHPGSDAGWGGWLWHSYFAGRLSFASATGYAPNQVHQLVVDSKAMRKVGDNERLVLVVQNTGTQGIVFTWSVRFYSKPF